MKNIAILASGEGTNAERIIRYLRMPNGLSVILKRKKKLM